MLLILVHVIAEDPGKALEAEHECYGIIGTISMVHRARTRSQTSGLGRNICPRSRAASRSRAAARAAAAGCIAAARSRATAVLILARSRATAALQAWASTTRVRHEK